MIKALEHASKMEHIMDFTRMRCLGSLFSMLHQACRNVALYNNNHPDFPMPIDQLEKYMQVMFSFFLLCIERSINAEVLHQHDYCAFLKLIVFMEFLCRGI